MGEAVVRDIRRTIVVLATLGALCLTHVPMVSAAATGYATQIDACLQLAGGPPPLEVHGPPEPSGVCTLALERFLLEYYGSPSKPDKRYGSGTGKLVRAFQREVLFRSKPDGRMDIDTWRAVQGMANDRGFLGSVIRRYPNYMIVGDSLTSEIRSELGDSLAAYGSTVRSRIDTRIDGVRGRTSLGLLAALKDHVDHGRVPDLLIIGIGGNDAESIPRRLRMIDDLVQRDIAMRDFLEQRVGQMFDGIEDMMPRVEVVVLTLGRGDDVGKRHRASLLNDVFRTEQAERAGRHDPEAIHLTLVEWGAYAEAHTEWFSSDNRHFNQRGQLARAKCIIHVLSQYEHFGTSPSLECPPYDGTSLFAG